MAKGTRRFVTGKCTIALRGLAPFCCSYYCLCNFGKIAQLLGIMILLID